jgi:tripeptidyl-peptidase-1
MYRHTETSETVIRTVSYSLPAALHGCVQTVTPTTYFGSPRPQRQTSKVALNGPTLPDGDRELQDSLATFAPGDPIPSNCSSIMTPTCLRLLYNTWKYTPQATSKNKIGITGYSEQYASYSDFTEFLTRFRTDAATANFSFVSVNGGINNQSQPGTEVRLVCHVEDEWGCNISSHRPISTPNTPSRSPTRPRSPSIAHTALHPTSLMK